MSQAIAFSRRCKVRLIPYELAEGMERTRQLIGGLRPGEDVAVFIGPEGGFRKKKLRWHRKRDTLCFSGKAYPADGNGRHGDGGDTAV